LTNDLHRSENGFERNALPMKSTWHCAWCHSWIIFNCSCFKYKTIF